MKKLITFLAILTSMFMIAGSYFQWLPLNMTEVLGFITGALCVWLTVKENIWNWPIGIANSAVYLIVFLQSRLFADMSLQVIYIILGFFGWYWWLKGGKNRTVLKVTYATPKSLFILLIIAALSTYGMHRYLVSINDSAPFLDALTTVLSLVAQYLLAKKNLENWYIWMTADVIYIGLYASRALYLTSGLYLVYLLMCISGFIAWRQSLAGKGAQHEAI